MNQEERREKRKKDTRNAMIVFSVFLVSVVLVVVGAVFALNRFVFNKDGEPAGTVAETENPTETEAEPETEPVPQIDPLTEEALQFVAEMSLEDRVAQMFVITPDALTGFSGVTAAGDTTKEAYGNRPVGGLIYMSENLKNREQTATMLENMQKIAAERTGVPVFLCVDEEGGGVSRIAGNSAFEVTDVGDMSAVGATGDAQNAYNAGSVIGTYLAELGFNVDFAPVADVLTNEENTVMKERSFGSDSALVADMVASELQGLLSQGVYGTAKHFPGHGGTAEDSHEGAATTEKTLDELRTSELVPFQRAVDADVPFVMVGHISAPNVTGENTPASLSKMLVTDVLRNEMGYQGVVITDAMNMKAITEGYEPDQAAVMAVNAGADMLLMPEDYETAYNGLLAAVNDGTVSETRINEAVSRIIRLKLQMNK